MKTKILLLALSLLATEIATADCSDIKTKVVCHAVTVGRNDVRTEGASQTQSFKSLISEDTDPSLCYANFNNLLDTAEHGDIITGPLFSTQTGQVVRDFYDDQVLTPGMTYISKDYSFRPIPGYTPIIQSYHFECHLL